MCVTEGNWNDPDKAVVQNIAQLSAVRDSCKRKCEEMSKDDTDWGKDVPFYGISTTHLAWQFTVLQNRKVKVSPLISIGVGTSNLAADVQGVVE